MTLSSPNMATLAFAAWRLFKESLDKDFYQIQGSFGSRLSAMH
ncbi:Uncharacterized protein APZ42_018362 [Daphnia magna]|uniref:Uncharacterized protein n=1 Tax=Daphnia magna TaxID=35525 RepID=A0A164Z5G7_9CRUS|nr:Uncharacterized protein APZ42_018362 [Daphnia magna]